MVTINWSQAKATFKIKDQHNNVTEKEGYVVTIALPGNITRQVSMYHARTERREIVSNPRRYSECPIYNVHDYKTGIQIPAPEYLRGSFDGNPQTPWLRRAQKHIAEEWGTEQFIEYMEQHPTINTNDDNNTI